MAKVNADGTINGEAKVVDENVDAPKTETGEPKKEDEKKPSKLGKGLKIAGGVVLGLTVVAVSVFTGTELKR